MQQGELKEDQEFLKPAQNKRKLNNNGRHQSINMGRVYHLNESLQGKSTRIDPLDIAE